MELDPRGEPEEPPAAADEVLEPDAPDFRNVLGHFATGVTIITAIDDDEPGGHGRELVHVGVARPAARAVLRRAHLDDVAAHPAGPQVRGQHPRRAPGGAVPVVRAEGRRPLRPGRWHVGVGGSPVLHDVLAYIDCEIWAEYDGGDHIIVVGRVLDLGITHDAGPLVFFRGRYGRLSPTSSHRQHADGRRPRPAPGHGNVVVVVVPGDAAHGGVVVRAVADTGTRAARSSATRARGRTGRRSSR